MLRDRHPVDKLFEEIIHLIPKMDPRLAKIDQYLEDEALFRLVRKDLARRWPLTLITGRNSTPVEVIQRMLVVRRLYNFSYEETERLVSDSLILRQFCRVYFHPVPDDTTLIRAAKLIRPETLEKFNERITQLAVEHKVTQGRKLRTDGTVVETNIHPPSDSWQLADSVRVLARSLERARKVLQQAGQSGQESFQDFTQAARKTTRRIGQTLKKRTEQAKAAGQQAYRELVEMTRQTVAQAQQALEQLELQTDKPAQRLAETLRTFIPRAEQVIQQTERRVFQGEAVPAGEKLVSIFEPHTDIIKREKERKPVEYGHKVWLNEVDGGIVSHYRVLSGNPHDTQQWQPSLKAHLRTFGHPPEQASGDRGLYSELNEQAARDLGIQHVVLPKRGYRSKKRKEHESQDWFMLGRRWHAGVEGRISVLQRAHGLARCRDRGWQGFQCWVGWCIIAGNLAVMGRA
jgi:transposase, IS5 family